MPRNWLNVFSAVRAANEFEAQEEQRRFNNRFAEEDQGFQRAAAQREETDWNTARRTATTLGALGAYSNMVDSIDNSGLAEEARPQAYAAAFDRVAPALAAAGYDPQNIAGLRETMIANPGSARDILQGLRANNGGSQPSLQAAFDANGRAVFIDPRTGREAARGFAPAEAVLGRRRVEVSARNADTAAGNLEQRALDNRPDHIFDENAARSEGRLAGENTARAHEALASGREVIRRIDTILNTDPSQLADVLGMPSLGGALRGGYGQFGAWPGSQRADIQSDIVALSSSLRSAAYQLVLKGGGQITEAESAFGAEAFANLQRSQSPAQFRENLMNARSYFAGLLERYQESAAPSRNPNRRDSARQGRAPAAAPSAPQGGFDVDAFLSQRGL